MANKFLRDDFDIAQRFGYHRQPSFNWNDYTLRVNDNDKSQVIGFELEVGCKKTITPAMYKKIVSLYPVIIESDSSILNDCRVSGYRDECELISQPMTMNYFYSTLDNLKELLAYLKENDFGSYDLGSCGLHIHFQRPSDEATLRRVVSRLWLIQETYKEQIAKIDGRSWYHYACNLNDVQYQQIDAELKSLEWLERTAFNNTSSHALAINLQHSNDVEIRSPRGTINFESFVSKVEFWNNAFTEGMRDQRISRLTWNKLAKGKYLTKYCIDKDIVTFKTLVDTTGEIVTYYNQMIKYNTHIMRNVSDFYTWVASQNQTRETKNYILALMNFEMNVTRALSYDTLTRFSSTLANDSYYTKYKWCEEELNKLLEKLNKMPKPIIASQTRVQEREC